MNPNLMKESNPSPDLSPATPEVSAQNNAARSSSPYQVNHQHFYKPKSVSTAVLLEVLPGLFGIFGIGHIYSGRVGLGIGLMVGFWVVEFINFLLTFVVIGLVTMPLCYVAVLIASPIMVANYLNAEQAAASRQSQ